MRTLLTHRILQPLFMPAMDFLQRSDIAVHTGSSQEDLVRLHFEHHANLIVTRPDLPGMSCESFVHIIRRSETVRNVSIMFLVPDAGADIARAQSCGVNAVLPLSSSPQVLGGRVRELLDVPRRRSYRVVLNMTVDGMRNNRPFLCSMENISSRGMLVRSSEKLSCGDRISCSFYLPDGHRVNASGNIVRTVNGENGASSCRYGVQFADLPPGDDAAIASFVEKTSAGLLRTV